MCFFLNVHPLYSSQETAFILVRTAVDSEPLGHWKRIYPGYRTMHLQIPGAIQHSQSAYLHVFRKWEETREP